MLLDAGEEQRQTAFLVVVGLLVVYYITGLIKYHLYGLKAAYVGYRSKWEPTWLLRLRFIRGSVAIIGEGYKNVSRRPCLSVFWSSHYHHRHNLIS